MRVGVKGQEGDRGRWGAELVVRGSVGALPSYTRGCSVNRHGVKAVLSKSLNLDESVRYHNALLKMIKGLQIQ